MSGAIVADEEYPQRAAFSLLNKILDEFLASVGNRVSQAKIDNCMPYPELENVLIRYQDPREADKIMKIQRDLDDTKAVLVNTIEAVLERGQKLDDLVDKSNDLSMSSKQFYKTAKKHNQCCVVQ